MGADFRAAATCSSRPRMVSTATMRASASFASILFLSTVSLVVSACSSSSSDAAPDTGDDAASEATTDADDAEVVADDARPDVVIEGTYHSYTLTITDAKATSISTGGPPTVMNAAPPSKGWVGRIDLFRETNGVGKPGSVRGFVISPTFLAPISGTGAADTGSVTLTALHTAPLITATGTHKANFVTDIVDTIQIFLDVNGEPDTVSFTGRSDETAGDVAIEYQLVGTMTLTADTTAPTMRAIANAPFATVSLPWDARVAQASEPYEEHLTLDALVGSGHAAADFTLTPLAESLWHGTEKERGVSFVARDWDAVADLAFTPPLLTDLAGNKSAGVGALPYGGVKVVPHGIGTWAADDGKPAAFLWGTAAVTTTGCASGSCVAIGPFDLSYACSASQGGLATRLTGSGSGRMVRVRAIASPTVAGSGGPPSKQFLYWTFTSPGQAPPTSMQVSSALWGTAAADGSYDTGWQWFLAAGPTSGPEVGIALSAGGTGSVSCGGSSGFTPPPYRTTVFVQQIDVATGI